MAEGHESKAIPGEYGTMPWLRGAWTVRVDPEPEGPEGLGAERPLRHVPRDRAGPRGLGERPKQMTWFCALGAQNQR